MKFKDLKVYSHPRTGSHYAAALISTNFFNEQNYLKFYRGHLPYGMSLNPKRATTNSNTAFIYIRRNFNDTAKSIFKLRDRFGLNVPNYDKFMITPYSKMWSGHKEVKVIRETLTDLEKVEGISSFFRNVSMTPKDYHKWHFESWSKIKQQNNIFIISYDKLKEDFNAEMSRLAKFLGSDKTNFINIDKKVGWKNDT